MITIHAYCSYRLSPVGYHYGVLRYPVSGGGDYCALAPPEESPATRFVKTAFDNGFITNVSGKIPDSNSYVFLVKRYHHSYPEGHADIGKDVNMNMAFEFSEFDDYKRFATSFDRKLKDDESELKREMADMIHPDYAVSNYALDIRREKLDAFMSEMLNAQSDAQPSAPKEKTAFYVLSAQKDYCEELTQLFGLDSVSYGVYRSRSNDKKYMYAKKKALRATGLPNLPVGLILILILITLLGIFLLTLGRKQGLPNQTEVSAQEETQTFALPDTEEMFPERPSSE